MKWSEIRIHTTNEAIEPISNILNEIGASGLVIEDPLDLVKERDTFFGEVYELNPNEYPEEGVYIKTYLPENNNVDALVQDIKKSITHLQTHGITIGENHVTRSEINEEDWANAWKKYYKPMQISEKITIIPTWEEYEPKSSEEIIIELDPGMAFGTGTHPTTKLSIQALEKYVKEEDVVIDVGCGSGVLSIASSLLGAKSVHAYDLDGVAVNSTIINAKLNNQDKNIEAKENDLLDGVNVSANVIVSNILAEIIVRFVNDAWNTLVPGGIFIVSGIIKSKEMLVQDELKLQGFNIVEVNEIDDWISITAKKVY
ncbi:ribosomal protein L11 methyltransferase [Virgibacillus natechei]|uniref:Ribosomal protein L11 methyltransferase n=1 Tax=Virgibacillus natechei TaxID=1216297 RepID=A0ABS4ICS0_9BACI|nr:50S ribosomal protein L11 methyltransferase [Virgibacillus natechei]MBP1968713.1 ribosomal protein L11 methyltransferase [Virgibacillus natechei]UZD11515.1 50S ribosomal protein L11 methyltransferase [Virgibacillus natechei]